MIYRRAHAYSILLLLLGGFPTAGFPSDQALTPEEARRVVSDLIHSVSPAYECEFSNVSFKAIHDSSDKPVAYIVTFEGAGLRCDDALEVLNYRGKSKRLLFRRDMKPERIDKSPERRIFDLIDKINPPIHAR